jgi:hypothetical protein
MTRERNTRRPDPPTWAAFSVWAGVGAISCFLALVLGTIGLALTVVFVVLAASRPTLRSSAWGVATGAGLPLLYVAWVQRKGPGTICWSTASASGCDQYANPWPWLVVGLVLLSAGVVAHARRMRSTSASVELGDAGPGSPV